MTLAAPFTVLVFVHPERHIDTHMCVIYMAFIYLARRAGSLILYYTVCIRKVSGGNGYRFVRWYKNKTSICRGKRFVPKVFFFFSNESAVPVTITSACRIRHAVVARSRFSRRTDDDEEETKEEEKEMDSGGKRYKCQLARTPTRFTWLGDSRCYFIGWPNTTTHSNLTSQRHQPEIWFTFFYFSSFSFLFFS